MIIKQPAAYDMAGSYETVADWSKVSPKPLIVFHKATEGNYYKDSRLTLDFAGMKANGIKRGVYHFFIMSISPEAQAKYFCDYVRPMLEPTDYIVLDFEVAGGNAGALKAWFDAVRVQFPKNPFLIYSRKNILDPIEMTDAQRFYFKQIPVWTAGYPNNPDLFNSPPTGAYGYVPDQTKWGPVYVWQYSDKGVVSGVTGNIDLDWLSPEFVKILGVAVPQPVEHTTPAPGIDEYTETVNGVKCHITLIEPLGKTFHIRHFPGGLGYVSQVAKETGALVAFNGIDYNEDLPVIIPYAPAYTAGVAANGGNPEFRYFLNISKTNISTFVYKNFTDFYNTTAFVRPLVIDGAMAPDIRDNPNKLEYTEVHACAAFGIVADGRYIQIATEGKVDPLTGKAYQGITVPQLVSLLLKYNTVNAGQHGGGGDVCKAINGTVINSFSDPQERAVAQVIYVTGASMNGKAKESQGNSTRVRSKPSRYASYSTTLAIGATVEFIGKVPALAATATTPLDKAGEMWLELPDHTFVNYKLFNTSGVLTEMFAILQEPTVDPVPAPAHTVDVVIDGVNVFHKDLN